jgi:hypothetical protein
LGGCATKYQEMGFTGGVAAEQITSDTWRILARGNAYTGGTRVQDFVLMKAAETTRANGGTHFIIGSSQDASREGAITTPGTAQTTFAGNTAFTTFSPGSVHTYVKPGQDAYVRVLKIPPGTQPPPGALDANEIIRFIGPRLQG